MARCCVADNNYSSVANARALFEERGIRIVMTKTLRERKAGKEKDLDVLSFPFSKPPKSVADALPRGWQLQARATLDTDRGPLPVVGTLWRDTKLIGFLATTLLGNTPDLHVDRRLSGCGSVAVRASEAAVWYQGRYGAVDRVDRGVQDFPLDFRQVSAWYKRPALFALDVVVVNIWELVQIHALENGGLGEKVCYCEGQTEEGKSWRGKKGKEASHDCFVGRKGLSGREKFQLGLGMDIISLAAEWRESEIADGATDTRRKSGPRGGRPRSRKRAAVVEDDEVVEKAPRLAQPAAGKRKRGRPPKYVFVPHLRPGVAMLRYCRPCYWRVSEENKDKVKELRETQMELLRRVPFCRSGCQQCNVYVYRACQPSFVHKEDVWRRGRDTLS